MDGLSDCFAALRDPRSGNGGRHSLLEILMIALCTFLCGGQTIVDMAVFGEAKREFLQSFLSLDNGIPSHDTFGRIFRRLDPDEFRGCFQKFMAGMGETCSGVIAIDGKALRRSFDAASAKSPLHMVSAWGCEQHMVLAQIGIDGRSQEARAAPKLLDMLSLKGAIVVADALHCRRELAHEIVGRGGDYALPLKANLGGLYRDVRQHFEAALPAVGQSYVTLEEEHGRIETRTVRISCAVEALQRTHQWPGLAAIGQIVRERTVVNRGATRRTMEAGYYLLSSAFPAERLAGAVRSYWGIENRLHWVLDVVMNEDQSRSRMDNSAYNLAILRHMALNLMRKDQSEGSLRAKFNLAGWSNEFLAKLLALG